MDIVVFLLCYVQSMRLYSERMHTIQYTVWSDAAYALDDVKFWKYSIELTVCNIGAGKKRVFFTILALLVEFVPKPMCGTWLPSASCGFCSQTHVSLVIILLFLLLFYYQSRSLYTQINKLCKMFLHDYVIVL